MIFSYRSSISTGVCRGSIWYIILTVKFQSFKTGSHRRFCRCAYCPCVRNTHIIIIYSRFMVHWIRTYLISIEYSNANDIHNIITYIWDVSYDLYFNIIMSAAKQIYVQKYTPIVYTLRLNSLWLWLWLVK